MNEKDIRKLIRESLESLDESGRATNTFEIASKITREVAGINMLDIRSMLDGTAVLFRYDKDGNAYEIVIRPASSIKDKEFWGNKLVSKEHPAKPMYRDLGINKKGE